MTMKDLSTGPDWIAWGVFVVLVTISATLLSGHGANQGRLRQVLCHLTTKLLR